MKQIGVLFATFVTVFFLTGCSQKPSDAEIEKAIRAEIATVLHHGDQVIAIKNYVKTNGFQRDANTYIAEVELFEVFNAKASADFRGSYNLKIFNVKNNADLQQFIGDMVEYDKCKVTFSRSEKGWVITDFALCETPPYYDLKLDN